MAPVPGLTARDIAGDPYRDLYGDPSDTPNGLRPAHWILALLIALALHALFFSIRSSWVPGSTRAPRVEVHEIDARKLEAVRRQWRTAEKQLLLSKDKSKADQTEAPKNARYMSDRNRIVEKEQRAKQTDVLPHAGSKQATNQAERQAQARPQTQAQTSHQPSRRTGTPTLGQLGIPLPTPQRTPQKQAAVQSASQSHAEQGADQALTDKNLPEGGENLLNTEESVYYSFYARLYEAIAPIWSSQIREASIRRKMQPGEYTTQAEVIFDAAGMLLDVHEIKSSGIPEFDNAVQVAWRKVGQFPNPPQGLLKNGQVHTGWNFTVQVGQGTGLQFLPPERAY